MQRSFNKISLSTASIIAALALTSISVAADNTDNSTSTNELPAGLVVSQQDITQAFDQLQKSHTIAVSPDHLGDSILMFKTKLNNENPALSELTSVNALTSSRANQDDRLQVFVDPKVPLQSVQHAVTFWNSSIGSQVLEIVNDPTQADLFIGSNLKINDGSQYLKSEGLSLYALTTLDGDDQGQPLYQNFYNVINIQSPMLDALVKRYPDLAIYDRTITHELGHALGLGHVTKLTPLSNAHQVLSIMKAVSIDYDQRYQMDQATLDTLSVAMLGWPISVQMTTRPNLTPHGGNLVVPSYFQTIHDIFNTSGLSFFDKIKTALHYSAQTIFGSTGEL